MAGGRRGQRGLTRMDAALDHLGAMGFPKAAIRKKINELLKEYGGPDGWVFIEDASYSLVINQLVPDEEGSEPGAPHLVDAVSQENMHGDAVSSSAAGSVNALVNPDLNMVLDVDKNGGSHQGSAVTSMDEVSFTQQDVTNNEDVCPPGDHTPLEVRHAPPLPPPHQQKVTHAPPSPPPPPPPEMEYVPPPPPPPPPSRQRKVNHGPPLPPPPPPEMEPSLPPVRRPCYGWWGEETDVITLPKMPVKVKGAR